MKKILIIFGTRPEAIKLAPVIRRLRSCTTGMKVSVCITAQHRQMLDQVLRIFDIRPEHDLNIMKKNQDLFEITARTLSGLKNVLKREKPDLVMVQGDTTSAFVSGLAAFYYKIPVAHVESGLRTHDKFSPFPEEKNRQLLSVLGDFHFAPTEWAKSNLIQEGIPEQKIWVTGNTVIDALLYISRKQNSRTAGKVWEEYFRTHWDIPISHKRNGSRLLLVTGHRRENFGERFESICHALHEISMQRNDVRIVYPVHLNPHVQKPVKSILKESRNIRLIEPIEYEPFVFLMKRSYLILTDSGGIQEEAPSLGKPVLVMRDTTERPEGIEAGTTRLVGTDRETIVRETFKLLDQPSHYEKMSKTANPYGDGKAADRIAEAMNSCM